MKETLNRLRTSKYRRLQDALMLFTAVVPLLITFGGEILFSGNGELIKRANQCGLAMFLFLSGCVGLMALIRREFRQVVMVYGRPAQIMGLLLWLLSWAVLIYGIVWIFFLDQ